MKRKGGIMKVKDVVRRINWSDPKTWLLIILGLLGLGALAFLWITVPRFWMAILAALIAGIVSTIIIVPAMILLGKGKVYQSIMILLLALGGGLYGLIYLISK